MPQCTARKPFPLFAALLAAICLAAAAHIQAAEPPSGLEYLESDDPYHVHRNFPKLTTPQWFGEPGVEAVIILSIDDMRGHEKWESYLRPILERLKQHYGKAPVSIMTCSIDPNEPHLQSWLQEGLSLEVHTVDHPCPLLKDGNFDAAKSTYDRCVDMLAQIPGSKPVAFRMPCCDSLNTPSPRFYAEIFNRVTPGGNFLAIDSSVFNIATPNDPSVAREHVLAADGTERFRHYLPFPSFVNTVEDYPYPYVIGRLCWEFPCVIPSDWEAQHVQQPFNPKTVEDLKHALDVIVQKQGVFPFVFHPYEWIRPSQVVELVDYAHDTYGDRVRFVTFAEALQRIETHLLGGHSLRDEHGADAGIRLMDLNADSYLDVVAATDNSPTTRLWNPASQSWTETSFPRAFTQKDALQCKRGALFGRVRADHLVSCLFADDAGQAAFTFKEGAWQPDEALSKSLMLGEEPVAFMKNGLDTGARLWDINGDGTAELCLCNPTQNAVLSWNESKSAWQRLPFTFPPQALVVDDQGRDAGLRLVDLDEDGMQDIACSNDQHSIMALFRDMQTGWSQEVLRAKQGQPQSLPAITSAGTNMGVWFHSGHLWQQNEFTAKLPDLVDRRKFSELLRTVDAPARSPQASLKSLHVRPGFQVELVAAEPLIADPVAFDWAPDGSLWVAEMADYPLGNDNPEHPGGRVRLVKDTDRDGKYDTSTVFMHGLNYPNGVLAWKNGVIVSAAPNVIYAEDTNNDGIVDHQETLLTGFVEGNPQHRANGLRYGLDNWVYCANGDSGGTIRSEKTGVEIDIGGRDLRFRPGTGELEAQTGQTQFGRERDAWGHWFGCNNANPGYHFVLEDHYLARNPLAIYPPTANALFDVPGAAPVFPESRTPDRFNDLNAVHRFTSACGPCFYGDELFGPAFDNNFFICEPVHNLVHREIVRPAGASFKAKRPPDDAAREFLASSDPWFRPSMVRTGPDGALWVCDMYRAVIEHPEWIPDDWEARLDLRAGSDRGRIYRISPVGISLRPFPRLDRASPGRLLSVLESPNAIQRDLAQRMLVWKNDPSLVPALLKLASEGRTPFSRMHAMYVLDGMHALSNEAIETRLHDPDFGVRRHALRLAESRLPEAPQLGAAMAALARDSDAHTRMQVALSIRDWPDPEAAEALAELAAQDGEDPFMRAAIISSANPHLSQLAEKLGTAYALHRCSADLWRDLLAIALRAEEPEAIAHLLGPALHSADDESPQSGQPQAHASRGLDSVAALLRLLSEQGHTLEDLAAMENEPLDLILAQLPTQFSLARQLAANETLDMDRRMAALTLLGQQRDASLADQQVLLEFLTPTQPVDLQMAAVATLGRLQDEALGSLIVARWQGLTPRVRSAVLETLFARAEWLVPLLEAIEAGDVLSRDLDAARRQQLMDYPFPQVRDKARALFGGDQPSDRKEVIAALRARIPATGDAARGKATFVKRCGNCHAWEDEGRAIGPDLRALTDKSPEALLTAIIDPNRAVESKFASFMVETQSGQTIAGMLLQENATSITLATADGKSVDLLRKEIAAMSSAGKSLMPEGLEKDLSPQDLTDLMTLLREQRLPRKQFPGNEPLVIQPEALRREFWLLASNAEVYGDTLVYEQPLSNLGYWQSESDHASWTMELAQEGTYDLFLEYACESSAAGNLFVVEIAGNRFSGTVQATGSWEEFTRVKIGQITLPVGTHRLSVRADHGLKGFLFDLRSVNLRPPYE